MLKNIISEIMEPINVVCFYWKGDRWNDSMETGSKDLSFQRHMRRSGIVDSKLASTYINNLYEGVKKYADRPFDFICFTNEQDLDLHNGILRREFELIVKEGVLPRLWMFSENSGLFGRQTLCLDLDVVITGSLSDIMSYEGLFCTRSKFHPNERHKLDGDIMSFRAGKENEERFWKPFVEDPKKVVELTQGRERYWVRHVVGDNADRWDKLFPEQVVSYKWHCREGLPKNARIVSVHGHPRPHQAKDYWVKNYWKYK
jgi:hypothetical protein